MDNLLQLLLKFILYGFLLRFLFELHRVDYYHPLSQGLARLTNPLYFVVRRVIPLWRGVDLPLLVIALLIQLLLLYASPMGNSGASVLGMTLYALVRLAITALNLYLICLVVVVVASWINLSATATSFINLLRGLTSPMLYRIRGILPNSGVLDFSPMLAMIGIIVSKNLLLQLGQLVWRW